MKFIDLDAQYACIENEISQAMANVMKHKQFIMGPEMYELEKALSRYCDVKHVLSAASGTDALLMSLMAYDIGPGDGVIVPSFTFIATAEVVALLGATVIFAEVDECTFNMDVAHLEKTIEQVRAKGEVHLKGVIPVDVFGLPADQHAIQALANKHGLFVLCDIAQSFGAQYQRQKTGGFGDISATSFFPAKPLGCYGDGGAVFTNNDELAEKVESIRFHGKGASQYENIRIGLTGRMDTLQAAVLNCKLGIFEAELVARQTIADRYAKGLSHCVQTPKVEDGYRSSWAVYTIRSSKRDQIKQVLQDQNIPCAVYYPSPLHRQPAFASAIGMNEAMPVTDMLAKEVISLPIHPYLSKEDQQIVIETICSIV